MKAIYNQRSLCVIVEDGSTGVLLEPVVGGREDRFWADLSDPKLLVDPTDDEIDLLEVFYP